MKRHPAIPLTALVVLCTFGACTPPDPVHDRAVDKLGDETGNADEFHRAGQPCATCHNSKSNGPADTDFSVAGTVFATPKTLVGVEGVIVEITDSAGTSPPPMKTNCVGNFWTPRGTWDPVLPIVKVKMTKDKTVRPMLSPIGQAASCAECHQAKVYASDPLSKLGAIYLFDGPAVPPPPANCPVNPALVIP